MDRGNDTCPFLPSFASSRVDRGGESGMPDEGEAELGVVLAAVILAQADHVVVGPCREGTLDDRRQARARGSRGGRGGRREDRQQSQ
jgi:hypothetical protein